MRFVLRLGMAVAIGCGTLASVPATGAVATRSFVTMVSEAGDYIGGGASRTWYTGSGSITLQGDNGQAVVHVEGGVSGDYYDLRFAAAPGQKLTPGVYENAQRTPFRTAGHPGIDIYGDGRGCNTIGGRFTVLDYNLAAGRLHLIYEQHCEEGVPALFGEVSIGEPADAELLVVPQEIQWPERYPGVPGRAVPVQLVNVGSEPVSVNAASITAGASQFSLLSNQCGQLAVGASCNLYLNATPTVPGPIEGMLTIADSTTSGTHSVHLAGSGISGYTGWTMESDPGDYIGAGQSYAYTPANATIVGGGSESHVHVSVTSGDDWWSADFEADSAHLLLPGTTFTNATRYPFNSSSTPGLSISGSGRGCNQLTGSFTVLDASYSGGQLQSIALEFEQHCEGAGPALRGRIDLRSTLLPGDPPPAPVTGLQAAVSGTSATLAWTDPTDPDWAASVVRRANGSIPPATALDGQPVYDGTGGTVTVDGLDPTQNVSFSVFPRDTAGNVGAGRSVIVRASDLTLSADRGALTLGGTVTLQGRLSALTSAIPLGGRLVTILQRPAGASDWSPAATVVTASDGSFQRVLAPEVNTDYAARFAGGGAAFAVTSATRSVGVRAAITFGASRTSVPKGGSAKLLAQATPAHGGSLLELQERVSGSWRSILVKPLTSEGRATFTVRPTGTGTKYYRVVLPGHDDHVRSLSAKVSLKVG